MVYCACKVERDGEQKSGVVWPSDRSILRGHAHSVSRIVGMSRPGCEGYEVDWLLVETVRLRPIFLPHGIGRNGRFPNSKNPHLHAAFAEVKRQLSAMS